jgi:hypothetical protein
LLYRFFVELSTNWRHYGSKYLAVLNVLKLISAIQGILLKHLPVLNRNPVIKAREINGDLNISFLL